MAYVNLGVKEDHTYEMMDLNSETTGQYMNSDVESNSAHTTEPAHIANVIEDQPYKTVGENTEINGEDEYTLPTISTFNDYITPCMDIANATIGDNEDNSYATVNENTTSNNDIDTDVYTPARVCAQAHIGSTNYCKRKMCKIIPITLISCFVIAGAAIGVVLTLKHQEINDCLSSPCKNGATCNDTVNSYTCTCTAGWAGTHCDMETDECSSSPCWNGATCNDHVNGYTCNCTGGWKGTHCEQEIDECSNNPCMNGATCVDGLDNYSCGCVAGYSGLNCQIDIDECRSSPCKNGATCVDGLGSYSCRCQAGYKEFNCQTAECNGACTNVVNGFRLCNGSGVGVCNPMQGRLEVYYNNTWGTVCDDYWGSNYSYVTPKSNANVACRIFGYSSGDARPEAFFGYGKGPIWLDNVMCVGTEQSLLECSHQEWGSNDCNHIEDTGVECKV